MSAVPKNADARLIELLREARALEPTLDSFQDVARCPNPALTALLLGWVEREPDELVVWELLRALCRLPERFDGQPLARRYDATGSEFLRDLIAKALASGRAGNLDGWLAERQAQADPASERALYFRRAIAQQTGGAFARHGG